MSTPEDRNPEQIKQEIISNLKKFLECPRSPYGGKVLHSNERGVLPGYLDKRRKA